MNAYRCAGVLRYAAIQFVVLTTCAMAAYAGGTWMDPTSQGYDVSRNFFSDLGAIHAHSGRSNRLSMVLFAISMLTVGGALAAFARTWREFGFARGRARIAGVASTWLGTASGAAFAGIALVPIDRDLDLHNALVVSAFGLLLGYVASLTALMWRNAIGGLRLAANLVYLAIVAVYVAFVVYVLNTPVRLEALVISQKVVVYASMVHVVYLTTTTRRAVMARS